MADDDVKIDFGAEGISRIAEAFRTVEAHARAAAAAQVAASNQAADAEVAAEVRKAAIRAGARQAIQQATEETKAAKKAAARAAADAEIGEYQRVVDAHRKAEKEKASAKRYAAEYDKIMGLGTTSPFAKPVAWAQGQAAGASAAWDKFDAISATASAAIGLFRSGLDLATDALTHLGQSIITDVIVPQAKLQTSAAQLANRMDGVGGDEVQATLNAMASQFAALDPAKIQEAFESAVDATHNMKDASLVTTLALKDAEAFKMDPSKTADFIGAKRREFKDMDPAAFTNLMNAELAKSLKGGLRLDEMGKYADRLDGFLGKVNAPTPEAKAANDLAITSLLAKASEKLGPKKAIGAVEALFKDIQTATGKDKIDQLHVEIPKLVAAVGGDIGQLGKKGQSTDVKGLSSNSVNLLRQLGVGDVYKDAEAKEKGSGSAAVSDFVRQMMEATGNETQGVQAAFEKVDATPVVAFNQAVEQAKEALYPLANEVLKKLVPLIRDEGPKLAKAVADLASSIDAKDVVAALKGAVQGIAAIAYYAMDIMDGVGESAATKAMRKMAGIGDQNVAVGAMTEADYIKDDQRLHPERYKTGGFNTVAEDKAVMENIAPESRAEMARALMADKKAGNAPSTTDGVGDAFSMKNQGIGGAADPKVEAGSKNFLDAAAAMLRVANKLDLVDLARLVPAGQLPP